MQVVERYRTNGAVSQGTHLDPTMSTIFTNDPFDIALYYEINFGELRNLYFSQHKMKEK